MRISQRQRALNVALKKTLSVPPEELDFLLASSRKFSGYKFEIGRDFPLHSISDLFLFTLPKTFGFVYR